MTDLSWVTGVAALALGLDARDCARLHGGRNNQTYRVELADGRRVVLKRYAPIDDLGRDRRATEYGALTFLADRGVTAVPAPLGTDAALNVAAYSYVDGAVPGRGDVNHCMIDAAVEFFATLSGLREDPAAAAIAPASEACFDSRGLAANVLGRIRRLEPAVAAAQAGSPLRRFFESELEPAARAAAAQLAAAGDDRALPRAHQTLSPSDVGFHNMLCREGAPPVFVDFEYFGWDDPAKLISDFLTQHDFELSPAHAGRFVTGMLTLFGADAGLISRMVAYFPLFRAKKAAIALNEFTVADAGRRRFAAAAPFDEDAAARQLATARNVLSRPLPGEWRG